MNDTLLIELRLCFYWIKKHQPPFERIRHLWGCLGFLPEAIQVLSDDSAHEVPKFQELHGMIKFDQTVMMFSSTYIIYMILCRMIML